MLLHLPPPPPPSGRCVMMSVVLICKAHNHDNYYTHYTSRGECVNSHYMLATLCYQHLPTAHKWMRLFCSHGNGARIHTNGVWLCIIIPLFICGTEANNHDLPIMPIVRVSVYMQCHTFVCTVRHA